MTVHGVMHGRCPVLGVDAVSVDGWAPSVCASVGAVAGEPAPPDRVAGGRSVGGDGHQAKRHVLLRDDRSRGRGPKRRLQGLNGEPCGTGQDCTQLRGKRVFLGRAPLMVVGAPAMQRRMCIAAV